jgi:hypothetical protein
MSIEHSPARLGKYSAPRSNILDRVAVLGDLTELNTKEAAGLIGRSPRTLENWRHRGCGPGWIAGSASNAPVSYTLGSIKKWTADRQSRQAD